jgi:hypothetical protein
MHHKKSPHCCGDLLEAFASNPPEPTKPNSGDDCAHNEQFGQPLFISDNNANGGSKNKILTRLRRQYPN